MARCNRKDEDEPSTQIQLGVMSPKIETNLLKIAYMESSSTIYGGSDPDEDSEEPDGHVTAKKRKTSLSLLRTREARALRKELRFFFMNPIQKWRFRRRFPWKLLVQIFKIILVTAELVMFANYISFHHGYHDDTTITLSNLFLKGWASTREVLSYPPPGGPIAVYRQSEFYEYMDYAIVNYAHIADVSMAAYSHAYAKGSTEVVPATFCVNEFAAYVSAHAPGHPTLSVNGTLITKCTDIHPSNVSHATFSLENFLKEMNFSIDFELLSSARLRFLIEAVRLRVEFPDNYPDCHLINGSLVLDNAIGGSQMVADLDLNIRPKYCHGILELSHRRPTTKVMLGILDFASLIACFFSIILCARSLHNATNLKKETDAFFVKNIGRPLTRKERWEFVNMWYVTICIDDILLIAGIFLRVGMATKDQNGLWYLWSVCAITLGVGNFLAWVGILRYLGFFDTYNVLILTLKKCAPNVLRLLVCILLLFFGYTFAGYLILGPYHFKFRTFYSSMECLFSLINGDDMFASFFSTDAHDPLIWFFSRAYLYSFISLFMWVVLSIFLAVIMDAYESVKRCYEEGFPRTGLMKFVNECSERAVTRVTNDRERTAHDTINALCCCVQR
ncbi:mucolipin-3-like isoform X2 [Macrobrachium nipponense]|uniref:mucolipin-3-like isoform X2 n=1 Tax=Macrobrachium nipponense TaxID=159736 RepID=UPI0030C81AA4